MPLLDPHISTSPVESKPSWIQRGTSEIHFGKPNSRTPPPAKFRRALQQALYDQLWQPTQFGSILRAALGYPLPRQTTHRCILIACFPKSGSTYLSRLLSLLTGRPRMRACAPVPEIEQNIRERELQRCRRKTSVIQQHVKGTRQNVQLLAQYGIRPVVLVRNIFDVVPSLHDHLCHNGIETPLAYVPREFALWDESRRHDWIIDLILPWYFNFYKSWVEHSADLDGIWVTYEDLFSDPRRTVDHILACHDIKLDPATINATILTMEGQPTRKNVGISGRGAQLNSRQRRRIEDMAAACALDRDCLSRVGVL